jgi:predicted DCC family thiol-disulfide oxidoreductase YuxK
MKPNTLFDPEAGTIQRPVLVYDANCSFCRGWVARLKRHAGDKLRYVSIGGAQQHLSAQQCAACEQAIHLFMPDGAMYRGAGAVFRVWALSGRRGWLLWLYERVPGVAPVAEAVYRMVARHRLILPG